MNTQNTLLLSRADLNGLLSFQEYIDTVEQAFALYAEGQTLKTGLLHIDSTGGEFHIKAGGLLNGRAYFGVKVNGGFFQNATRFGMPNIQGAILLCDGENGSPLAIMDSIEITKSRTGAATAVAAKYLARPESSTAMICGCGNQGRIQLRALKAVLPIKRAFAFGRTAERVFSFSEDMSSDLGIAVTPVAEDEAFRDALRNSDVCVTCTPARQFFIRKEDVAPGTFIAAVGADSPYKQELEPSLVASSKVVVDILAQCAEVGELHHAIGDGLMQRSDVHGELGEIVSGKKPGRTSDEDITIFDSTGTALQDVAAAAAIYEKALKQGKGTAFNLSQ
jgi:alanine dehydrogenase